LPTYSFDVPPAPGPPQSPFISIDRHAGRPPRILQWSLNLQRELSPNLLVEAAYVGNRGVWWSAPTLQSQNYNALTLDDIKRYGLDINSASDRTLLTTQIQNLPNAVAGPQFLARYP